jgi:hypothetical protein
MQLRHWAAERVGDALDLLGNSRNNDTAKIEYN